MLFTQADKVHQLVLRIRRVGVVHGRAAVTETPFWPEQRFAGQANKRLGHIQHAFAGKNVVIDIARFGLPAAVGGVIVVDLVAQIQPAAAEVVVKQAVAHVIAAGDGERNMLVQRVGAGRVVTHRIQVAHLKALAVTLQITRFLAQAVKAFVFTTAQVVCDAVAVSVQQIGAGGAVVNQFLPLTGLIAILPLQPQRLVDGHAQVLSGDGQDLVRVGQRPGGAGKAAKIFTRTAFPRHIFLRSNAPGFIQRQLAFALNQHAEQILFQHIHAQAVLIIDQQFQMVR
ncbi:hypothetical protein D3C75_377110 [compost metagenome]